MKSETLVLRGARVLREGSFLDADVQIRDGRISAVGEGLEGDVLRVCGDLVPGFLKRRAHLFAAFQRKLALERASAHQHCNFHSHILPFRQRFVLRLLTLFGTICAIYPSTTRKGTCTVRHLRTRPAKT